MPTVSAATSLPRRASSVRPTREVRRLLATIWQASAVPPMSQKYWVGVISAPPGSFGPGMAMMPMGPPVRLQRLAVTSAMKPKATVTMARYGPLARSEGRASRAPQRPARTTPAGAESQKGRPSRVASSADV